MQVNFSISSTEEPEPSQSYSIEMPWTGAWADEAKLKFGTTEGTLRDSKINASIDFAILLVRTLEVSDKNSEFKI
jgi:hypothetical protein